MIARCEAWFKSNYQVFNKSNLEYWFIAMLIEELIQNIDKDILQNSISNMQRHQLYYKINNDDYVKAASAVITAFIVTNARDLYEGVDNSIIYHFSTHNKIRRCTFSIFDIDSYINSKGVINEYIPFLIFGRLFDILYEHIFSQLQAGLKLSFNYYNINTFNFIIPDYVVVQRDNFFEVYESS